MDRLKARHTPRTAVVWSILTTELETALDCGGPDEPCRIVDVGGGTGGFAVPLAEAGYDVTVVDTSPNALAGLTRRAADAGVADRIRAIQSDAHTLDDVVEAGTARLVLCHSVLEMVDSPRESIAAMSRVLAPGGALSLLVANRAGAVLARAITGQLSAATTILTDPDGSGTADTLLRRFDPDSLGGLVTEGGLVLERLHGIQIAADLAAGFRDGEPGAAEAMREFELTVAARPPYRDIATQLHGLARKPPAT
ncbi:methyltransferase domain-containing protein [Stackebrandtia soli]|uniref:methyltransferase domain-containing protein n=1 Tax=Stackebrandtia soli TaxID=1892856 RepID=UPI0039ED492B